MRFPGFHDEWKVEKLGKVIDLKAGYAFKSERMSSSRSTYQLIKMSNVYQNELRLDRNPSFWNEIDTKQSEFLLRTGDTVLTLTGTVGKRDFGYSVQIKEDNKYLLNQRLVLLRERAAKSKNEFITQLVLTEKFLYSFFGESKGGTGNQTNVGVEDVKNILFLFPSISEQKKMGDFLALLDNRISTQNKIIKELESLKSTISKKIFSRHIRFKSRHNGDFPDWKVEKLGDLCEIIGGGTPETVKSEYWNGEIQWFTPTEIKSNYVFKSERTITSLGLKNSSAKILPKGTILLTTRATIGEVAIALEECTTNQGFQSLVTKKDCNNVFIFNWIKNNKNELVKRASGSTFSEISKSEIEKIEISIPCLSEQILIAGLFSLIDEKIEVDKRILHLHERRKKYLLNTLFI